MKTLNYNKQKREDMITAGAYDGRYRSRMVKDKKKEQQKKLCRNKNLTKFIW